ncbi:acetolactate synthase 3 large subunit, partial [Escherichia coli]
MNLDNRYLGMVKRWAGHDLFRPSFTILYAIAPDFVRLADLWSRRIQMSHPHELESKLSEALEQVRNNRLVFV